MKWFLLVNFGLFGIVWLTSKIAKAFDLSLEASIVLALFLLFAPISIYFLKEIINEHKERKRKKAKAKQEADAYHKRLQEDPGFRLQEEYKQYTQAWITDYQNPVWLEDGSEERVKLVRDLWDKSSPLFEGSIADPLFQKVIAAQQYAGKELAHCAECGKIYWREIDKARRSTMDGTDQGRYCSSRCKWHCDMRDMRHYLRSRGEKNPSYQYLKDCVDDPRDEFKPKEAIPLYEYAEKQQFRCAICGGKMSHTWEPKGKNYLYISVDHIRPVYRYGRHTPDNIQIVHLLCNKVKWIHDDIRLDMPADEFLAQAKTNLGIRGEDSLIMAYRKHIVKPGDTKPSETNQPWTGMPDGDDF
jgi:hypothetical protein